MKNNTHKVFSNMTPEDFLDQLDCCSAPVNLEKICNSLNIKVIRVSKLDPDKFAGGRLGLHSGEIYMDGDDVVCWINPLDSSTRQRFTLAHEIGHYIYDFAPLLAKGSMPERFLDESRTLKRDGRQDPREYRANDFAARLLMPNILLRDEVFKFVEDEKTKSKKGKVSRELVFRKMAELFQVSKQAMEIRMISLGIVKRKN